MTTAPQHRAPAVGDLMEHAGLQIGDDVIVDTAIDILHSSGTDHLLVRGDDGRCEGLVTRLHLAPFRSRSWYTERTPVRDIVHDRAPFTTPGTPAAEAAADLHTRGLDVCPVVDHEGYAVGLISLRRLRSSSTD